ncbi:MAG TPA: A24 family peptidase [Pseudolabrys sp.]|nr:A24 family peptidase [Pseudolabrys sp.]
MITASIGPFLVLKIVFGSLLLAIVSAAATVDYRKMILPNHITFLLAVTGIAQSTLVDVPKLWDACFGAAMAALILGLVAALFRKFRGIEGLGLGDQKFAAAIGLWIGWREVALMLLMASMSALLFVSFRALKQRRLDMAARTPFGPFLGFGAIVSWLMGVAFA